MANDASKLPHKDRRAGWRKGTLLIGVIGLAAVVYVTLGEQLSLASLARHESQLRQFQAQQPALVYGAAFLVYVLVTSLSLPGAAGLTLVYGWYFGFWMTIPLVSFASTTGATLSFLMSRYLLRDWVHRRFGDYLRAVHRELENEGAFYLFTLRLIPAIPFFVINLVMGVTPIRASTFWWVSQLGMLPGTCVYIYAGAAVPNLQTLADQGIHAVLSPGQLIPLVIGFTLLGAFPLIARKVMRALRPATDTPSDRQP